ncbi:hypothetical protein EROM_081300 [Encephalitozoon romaleae SJ-2008]|uniref:Uncharacterized protein n=1 Tax=Encephalitozoon romaleae (strain SJ-2008) TaxID=1178016 RepID=I6ZUX4_ENCRO|nr:hypothetical protein EROM_081300 [Encephalitozoon romaleae SJ-2008]AFN83546.1 hypothetical protein EROM_081300 [Encephalitozoon romaleae SJ-2008]
MPTLFSEYLSCGRSLMVPVKARIFRSVNDEWEEICMGMIFRIEKDCIFIEDDGTGKCFEMSLGKKQCERSEKNIVIVYNDLEEHAVCFETEDIRDDFVEFMEKDVLSKDGMSTEGRMTFEKESNLFSNLLRISRYMDGSVFGRMLESRDGVLNLLRMEDFHLFRMLLENKEKVFELFGVVLNSKINKVTPHGFYREIIAKNLDESTARTYENFLIMINKQELTRNESKVTEMSDEEIRSFLKRCGSNVCRVGNIDVYLERIYRDNNYFCETFYYLCFIFRERMSEVVDLGHILCRTRNLIGEKTFDDGLLYVLEGLYILLDECKPEKLDMFYMEVSGLFDNLECHPDLQNFLIYLLINHGFRARELLVNTGLMERIFISGCESNMSSVFISKVLLQIVSCSSRFIHRYFIKNDLFRGVVRMYNQRKEDAAYSIFLQAFTQADGDMKIYLDRYIQN